MAKEPSLDDLMRENSINAEAIIAAILTTAVLGQTAINNPALAITTYKEVRQKLMVANAFT